MGAWPPLIVEPEAPPVILRVHDALALCVVRRTAAMCDLERRLRFAMVASVGGRRPAVSTEQVAAALRWRGITASAFSVHLHAPEDFLVVLESAELRRHVAGLPSVLVAGAPLVFRPWNRQAQARQVPLRTRAFLILEGIPPHAWDVGVVEDLLGKSCAVEEVAPETRSREDLSLFKLIAWTSDVDAIPVARMLAVPEPVRELERPLPPARELPEAVESQAPPTVVSSEASVIQTLQYRVIIHLAVVEEVLSEDSGVRGAQGGDRAGHQSAGPQDGNGGGGGESGRRRGRTLPWKRGVVDQRGGATNFASNRQIRTAGGTPEVEGRSWGLPPLASPAPLAVQTGQSWSGTMSPSVRSVGAQLERASQRPELQAQGAVGSTAAAPSGAGEVLVDQELAPHAEVVPKSLPSVAADPEEDHGRPQLETLPSVEADPEVDHSRPRLETSSRAEGGSRGGLERDVGPVFFELCQEVAAGPPGGSNLGPKGANVMFLEEVSSHSGAQGFQRCGSDTPQKTSADMPLVSTSATSLSSSVDGSGEGEYIQISMSVHERVLELEEGSDARMSGDSLECPLSDPRGSPCTSYTGPNSVFQLVPRRTRKEPVLEESTSEDAESLDSERRKLQQEKLALCRIRMFCSSILKRLAPPLLREVDSSSGLRAEAQPFTPRRLTRSTAMAAHERGKKASKASTAETVLLRALGICPEELSVEEEHLVSFNEIFDSPLGERHVRVMASIFGKMVPQSFDQQEGCRVAVEAH
ncbi:hypothetical protein QYE76_001168 [Lolium multiflorum]|uniref:DUF4283 domain-containing protein n=1 Tax=Lolium multiflorum TaxID=4521 RepID=A0AAD8VZ38_LOLMU|nr:hypothetical protein QYE76_001168 [Lolium multiflorum]